MWRSIPVALVLVALASGCSSQPPPAEPVPGAFALTEGQGARLYTLAMLPGSTRSDQDAAKACFSDRGIQYIELQRDPPLYRGGFGSDASVAQNSELRACLEAVENAEMDNG